jgi:alkylation response protein AidB-like acyl-CoA dehydrogenase
LTRALVTAHAPEGVSLFDVELSATGVRRIEDSWPAVGMAHSDSLNVQFDDVFVPNSAVIGGPGSYLARAGFWHGAIGVAACWYGGAVGCLRLLHERFTRVRCDEHAAAHVGAVSAICHALQQVLAHAAAAIDGDPRDVAHEAQRRALLVRANVERGCQEVLSHTGRASGSSALVFDARHARRAADLPVYLRQHHAEHDLAELGRSTLMEAACP